tara:strand:- start:1446 stop:1556 length:111 start_codon:yes stop_codon:yes gene_type:complete
MTVKWQPTYQCPYGCWTFFGSTVALNWHLEEHKETP